MPAIMETLDSIAGSLKTKVIHLTSAHPRDDIRIFWKECRSLAAAGYDVHLVVADGLGYVESGGVAIHDAGRLPGRLNRMFRTTRKVLASAAALDGDIYHLHDPELLLVALKLKRLGNRVIFDAHEDVPKQLLGKPYLNRWLLRGLSWMFAKFERIVCSRLDGIVAATPGIRDKFKEINPNTLDINNFPILGELDSGQSWVCKTSEVCYVGSIATIRGVREIVRALECLGGSVHLSLVGSFAEPAVEAEVREYAGWGYVKPLGVRDRQGVRDVLGRSVAGLVTLHPVINYLDALPIKMFEYMSAGIPVIASNFPLWREIVEGNSCGICVDPLDPQAIARAIDHLITHPQEAESMGRNGQRAVFDKYNWANEEAKLLSFYATLQMRSRRIG
jgi:glycosyltransferase involved in cell wall biosynthesis